MRWLVASVAIAAVGIAAMGSACRHGPGGRVRFSNEPIVWQVRDRDDVPEKPVARSFDHMAYVFQHVAHKPIDDALAVRAFTRAANVNSLDEVPDSTWFTNRIGVRDLDVGEITRGPNEGHGPDRSGPWQILRTKVGGASPGFLIVDRLGVRYVMKFDRPSRPEMETGADVVVQRILWAAGYNVPENSVVHFRRDRLTIGEGAVKELSVGTQSPLTQRDVDAVLSEVYRTSDGSYRAMTSRFLPGEPLGGTPPEGTRRDDPNDRVPHERLRELRGLYVFAAWLAHSDVKEDNTIDMWIDDPGPPRRHYVMHYLLDFGKALGVMTWTNRELHDGYVYNFDYAFTAGALLSLGFWERPWEARASPNIRGVGVFEGQHFHPGRFRARNRYVPFRRKDSLDAYWATKIVMRFTPDLLKAAVQQGQYSDPAAIEYLTRVLIERQLATGRYWFSVVNSLDEFSVQSTGDTVRVCGRDLLLWYGLEVNAIASTTYVLRSYDFAGNASGWRRVLSGRADGLVCADGLRPSDGLDGYTIVGFTTRRGRKVLPPVWLHLAAHPETGDLRVIGVDRQQGTGRR
jgi:hypothetical protein